MAVVVDERVTVTREFLKTLCKKAKATQRKPFSTSYLKKIPLIMSRNLTYVEKNEVESRVNLRNMKEDLVVHTHT